MTNAILIESLSFAYPPPLPGSDPVPALRGIDVLVSQREFVAVMGAVGAGKSTLCYALNGAIPSAIDGEFEGRVVVCGQDTQDVSMAQLATRVGLVFETTEAQLFNATVADEVAFGLEAMGLPAAEIENRIDQALEQVGLAGFRPRSPGSLSGGEQKRLALASVLAMRPQILILDEPTSGLDPRGRQKVIEAINRMRLELGTEMTVVMTTQDAEVAARFADRVIILQQGRIALAGSPTHVFAQVEQMDQWGLDVPQLARLAHLLERHMKRSIDFLDLDAVQQAVLESSAAPPLPLTPPSRLPSARPVKAQIQIRDLSHRYPEAEGDALQQIRLDILQGEWLAIIGVNGSGKSTLIKHLNGLLKPTLGQVQVDGQDTRLHDVGQLARTVSYLPQNPDELIFSPSVRDEVAYGPRQLGLKGSALEDRVTETLTMFALSNYADHPPAVLGYGIRRQVALASVLAMKTPVLALDEPAVGLDRGSVNALMDIISRRHQQGTTVIVITHDLQLVARYAQQVAVLQQGHLVAYGLVAEVLADAEQLVDCGLEPLPVTNLAYSLGWSPPLPLSAGDVLTHG